MDFDSIELERENIGHDFILVENIRNVPYFHDPVKLDVAVAAICFSGELRGRINLLDFRFRANDFFILLPGQIIQYVNISDDYRGLHMVLSRQFIKELSEEIGDCIPLYMLLNDTQVLHLQKESIDYMSDYYKIMHKALKRDDTAGRKNVIKHLILAMFYELGELQEMLNRDKECSSRAESVFRSFYSLVSQNYKRNRSVGFYADKLNLTSNYLSVIIKEYSGKSAFDWINDYVIMEARYLLKSTDHTVQQISYELNFPDPSFFGKYFKRHTGLTPLEYRAE